MQITNIEISNTYNIFNAGIYTSIMKTEKTMLKNKFLPF